MHTLLELSAHPHARMPPQLPALYADASEKARHHHYIAQLALEVDCPVLLIEPIYEEILARLKTAATVHDYLPILVSKGVKTALKELLRRH